MVISQGGLLLNLGAMPYNRQMNNLEVGAPKKSHWFGWAIVVVVLFGVLVAIQFVTASANDKRKKPLELTAEQAAGKCIGEVQLDYQAKGQRVVGRTEDFTVTGNNPGQMGVAGKITIDGLSSNVNCLIDVISSDGSTVTSYRLH